MKHKDVLDTMGKFQCKSKWCSKVMGFQGHYLISKTPMYDSSTYFDSFD